MAAVAQLLVMREVLKVERPAFRLRHAVDDVGLVIHQAQKLHGVTSSGCAHFAQ